MRRQCTTLLLTLAVLLATAAPALAHAGFVQSSVPADSDQTLQLRVPGERPGQYTVKVETLVPAAFEVDGCTSGAQFACTVAERAGGGHVVTWERPVTGGVPVDSGLVYGIEVHTPTVTGTYDFPTIQTYNAPDADGETEAAWIGDLAPQLEVTGAGTEPQQNEEEPDTSHSEQPRPRSSEPARTSPPDPADDDAGATDDTTSDDATSDGDTSTAPASAGTSTGTTDERGDESDGSTAAVATAAPSPTPTPTDAASAPVVETSPAPVAVGAPTDALDATDDGGSALPWIGAALLLAAGVALLVRRRMGRPD